MTTTLVGFLFGFIGSMPISGPISLLVFHRGLHARYRDGCAIGFGGAIAEGIYCGLAIYGLTTLLEGFTFLEPLAKGMGILLLLVIGLYFTIAHQENREERSVAKREASNWMGQFFVGFSVAALNPTLIFTWSMTAAMLYSLTSVTFKTYEVVVFSASVVIGIAAWFSMLLALLRRFRESFSLGTLQKVIRGIGAVLVVASLIMAVLLLFS